MFHNSTSAADTALPEHATVTSAEPQHRVQQYKFPAGTALVADLLAGPDPSDVEITAISPTEWRIADHAIDQDDPTALLGFTNLGRPRERAYFTSFDRATASLLPRGVLA
jgi:hypothetical protein